MFNGATRRILLVLGASLTLALACATSAQASANAIYQACASGASLSGFSKSDLQSALSGVPADIDEYFACSALINAAIVDKSTKGIGGKGIKGTRERLKLAKIEDLTTAKERARARAKVNKATQIDTSDPLAGDVSSAVSAGDGKTLTSAAAPSTPIALIIGLLGLVLLLGADIADRFGTLPGARNKTPDPDQRGDD